MNAQAIVDSVNGLTGTQYAASRTNDGSAVTITSNVTDFSVAATGANSANVPLNSLGATSGEGDHLVAYAAGFGLTISKNSNTVTVSLNDEFEYHVTQADTKTLLGYTSNQSTTVTAVVAVRATQAFALDQFSTTESYSLKIDGNDVAFAHEAETAGTAALTMVGSQQGTNYSIAMSAKGVNKTIEFQGGNSTRPAQNPEVTGGRGCVQSQTVTLTLENAVVAQLNTFYKFVRSSDGMVVVVNVSTGLLPMGPHLQRHWHNNSLLRPLPMAICPSSQDCLRPATARSSPSRQTKPSLSLPPMQTRKVSWSASTTILHKPPP